MIIEIIAFFIWLISTEIIYFGFARNNTDENNFLGEKVISGFGAMFVTVLLIGFPYLMTIAEGAPTDLVIYSWYYGIIISILIFLGINYMIHKWLEKNGK